MQKHQFQSGLSHFYAFEAFGDYKMKKDKRWTSIIPLFTAVVFSKRVKNQSSISFISWKKFNRKYKNGGATKD